MAGYIMPVMVQGIDPRASNLGDNWAVQDTQNYSWDIRKQLGEGAWSRVYMGRDKYTLEEVAVKVFKPEVSMLIQQLQSREINVMSRLNHENLVKLIAVEEGIYCRGWAMMLELSLHGSLQAVLYRPENIYGLCEEEFLLVLKHVSAGMRHLRENDIIHRDLKPANILRFVGENGKSIYKITDFGAARELPEEELFMTVAGTEVYMHPGMFETMLLRQPYHQYGAYVDLWSLGVTFYEAATGVVPFRTYGDTIDKQVLLNIIKQKQHGHISGMQLAENGPFAYSTELLSTCRLSLGLKRLVTPLLAALLEQNPQQVLSFDEFFYQVTSIMCKVAIDVFCPTLRLSTKIYAKRIDTLQTFKELISEQTDIPPDKQLLLVHGQTLDSLVPADVLVGQYGLNVTGCGPVTVLTTSGPFPDNAHYPAIGCFPDTTVIQTFEKDCKQSHFCYAVLHSIIRAVQSITEANTLISSSMHRFCLYLKQRTKVALDLLKHHNSQKEMTKHWHQSLVSQLKQRFDFLRFIASIVSETKAVEVSQTLHVHESHNETLNEIFEKIEASYVTATLQLNELLDMQAPVNACNLQGGCTTEHKCPERVEVIMTKAGRIRDLFKENWSKGANLTAYDAEVQSFEKDRLSELCTQAESVYNSCVEKGKAAHHNYKTWFEKATPCLDLVSKVEALLSKNTESLEELVSKLKSMEEEADKLLEGCVSSLKKDIAHHLSQSRSPSSSSSGEKTGELADSENGEESDSEELNIFNDFKSG